jgi:AcrR family transcriptional regulator
MGQTKKQKIQRREPNQRRSRATVDAILEASARIIRRRGIGDLTTNEIADVAGVSIGSLYDYFENKSAILLALARRFLLNDEAALMAALATAAPSERVRALVSALLERHAHDPAVRRAVMTHHIGAGFGAEHGTSVQAVVAQISGRLEVGEPDIANEARLFVVTRAVLGVARALIEEGRTHLTSGGMVEDELVRLIHLYLGDEALRWRPRSPFPNFESYQAAFSSL